VLLPRSKRQYVKDLNSGPVGLARTLHGARQSRFPSFIEPSLATLAARPPRGDNWLHEVKYDGYRFQCHVQRGVRFYSRRGHDWTNRLGHLASFMNAFSQHAIIFDGEVVVQTPEGRSDFHALEKELKAQGGSRRLVYYVFDLLYLDAFDLRGCPFAGRKQVLKELFGNIDGPVKLSEHLEGDGVAIWKQACDLDLEGIVSKRASAPYSSGRTSNWIKATCRHRDTFVVVGWAEKNGRFNGIYVGRHEGDDLVYAGKLEKGVSEEDKHSILKRLAALRVRKQPMIARRKRFPKAYWVKPVLLVDAEFRGKTGDGLLRHPSFKGIREDLE
jgi:bifunctional non-homologous end joining protein LigD